MKTILSSFVFLSFLLSAFAQSDEINISASFAQSLELRVIGTNSVSFSFSTINDYNKGKQTARNDTGFEVSSSTSFEVQAAITPLTNGSGDQIDMANLVYYLCYYEEFDVDKGVRWDIPTPDFPRVQGKTYKGRNGEPMKVYGFFKTNEGDKTLVVPGPSGNAGSFADNQFFLEIVLGNPVHAGNLNIPSLLDQNIQPGTYTCTMTLTAIPSVT